MISFFTHSGGAGIIRGEQIAKHLGAKLNPKDGYEDDVCIYIKTFPFPFIPKHTYIDVVEDSAGLRWVKNYPEVGIIASSKSIYNYLSNKLPNKIVLILQHHCNFERVVRTRKEVTVAGIIGNRASFDYPLDDLKKRLNEIGMELKVLIKKRFDSRKEIVNFYKQIDIQLVWRPNSDGILRNPLKLVNAMSFGIPTVAYPEEDFVSEFDGYFLPAKNIDELISDVNNLKGSKAFYRMFPKQGIQKVKDYHINSISKLYFKL